MKTVFPRRCLLYRHNTHLLPLLLFLLTELSFNSLLCDTTATKKAAHAANEFEGHGGKLSL